MNEFILVYRIRVCLGVHVRWQSRLSGLAGRLVCLIHLGPLRTRLLPTVLDLEYTSPLASIASNVVVVVAFVVCRPARKLYANVGGSRCCLRATHKSAN